MPVLLHPYRKMSVSMPTPVLDAFLEHLKWASSWKCCALSMCEVLGSISETKDKRCTIEELEGAVSAVSPSDTYMDFR